MDALQVYTSTNGGLTNFDEPAVQGGTGTGFGANADLVYDMDAGADGNVAVLIDSTAASGSGRPDLAVFIPVENFSDVVDPTSTYVYLYSAFGYQGGIYEANSGQEEWSTPVASEVGGVEAGINIVKVTGDGPDGTITDGDGVLLPVGGPVTWTYTVTNTGNVPLSNVTVTDDHLGVTPAYQSGDDGDTLLETGETWVYTATGTAILGLYNNIGTATGHYLDLTVSDTDPSSYSGTAAITAGLTIDKVTADLGDDDAVDGTPGDGNAILAGEKIQWQYTVTNTGNVDLANIVVVDDNGTPGDTGDDVEVGTIASLAAGASATLYLDGVAGTGDYANTATASGERVDNGNSVSDDNSSAYTGLNPQLTLDKVTADLGDDAVVDGTPGDGNAILAGENIQWQYTVTNTGNVDLANIVVVDDNGTPGDTGDDVEVGTIASLAAGASTTLYLDGVAGTGEYANNATATADPISDDAEHSATASDSDDSGYTGLNPQLTLDKVTADLGDDDVVDGTPGDGKTILTGEAIQWQYTVKNDGNVTLTNIKVVDDKGTAATVDDVTVGTIASLAAGASDTLTLNGVAGVGDYANNATATADATTDSAGHSKTATDDDDSSYFGAAPAIDVEKYVSVDGGATWDDADSPTGPLLTDDSPYDPKFKFVVHNTGNVDLSNITLSDSDFDLNGAAAGPTLPSQASRPMTAPQAVRTPTNSSSPSRGRQASTPIPRRHRRRSPTMPAIRPRSATPTTPIISVSTLAFTA